MQKTAHAVHIESDHAYREFETITTFRVGAIRGPLFTVADPQGTMIDNLFETYLEHLPENKQHYNCHACRRFVTRFGSLVQLSPDGRLVSPLWSESGVPAFFRNSVIAMSDRLARGKIHGVFVTDQTVWGYPVTDNWTHLSGKYWEPYNPTLLTAEQRVAELQQDYILLVDTLKNYSLELLAEAKRVLASDQLGSPERALEICLWFQELMTKAKEAKGSFRNNLIWSYVAIAPPGFVHLKNGMLGTLLDDIKQGLPFETVKERWSEKMHPLQYRRPQAAPTAGAIKEAEQAFMKLDLGSSLVRRYARLEDIVCFWKPSAPKTLGESAITLFGHLKPKNSNEVKRMELPPTKMSLVKFLRDILPMALKIEFMPPSRHANYFAFVTANDPNSKPLLQWDTEPRNQVSSYIYLRGSTPHHWNLASNEWVEVTGIAKNPVVWYHEFTDKHQAMNFILKGAHESKTIKGSAIFPEDVRSDLNKFRSVIEAHSKLDTILFPMEGTANGIRFSKEEGSQPYQFRVRVNGLDEYILDRWE